MEILNFPFDNGIGGPGLSGIRSDESPTRYRLTKRTYGVEKVESSVTSLESGDVVKGTKVCLLSPSTSRNEKQSNASASLNFPEIALYRDRTFISASKRSLPNPKLRHFAYHGGRGRTNMDTDDYSINPGPVPYQARNFMSSTMLKRINQPRHHLDTFGGDFDYSPGIKRGIILHTDRYRWDTVRQMGMNQRDRMIAEVDYVEALRGLKLQRETLPHRAELDLMMGGKQIDFSERFEIQKEIQKLKSLILPTHAKDLYHGRGFRLPENHSSIKPRVPPVMYYDYEDDSSATAPPPLQRLPNYSVDPDTGIVSSRKTGARKTNLEGHLPRITSRSTTLGQTEPVSLQREKSKVDSIRARLQMTGNQSSTLQRSSTYIRQQALPSLQRSQTDINGNGQAQPPVQSVEVKVPTAEPKVDNVVEQSSDQPQPEEGATVGDRVEFSDTELEMMTGSQQMVTGRGGGSEADRGTLSPVKAPTPNPLKGSELMEMLSERETDELKQVFSKLDTDEDGHLKYPQVKSHLPSEMSQIQERFIKVIYDIASSSTFFGVEEFLLMSQLGKCIYELSGEALSAYEKLNFPNIQESILQYVELFQSVDRIGKGKITLTSVKEILSTVLVRDLCTETDVWNGILNCLGLQEDSQLNKIVFLAHIPYFDTLKQR